MAIPGSDKAIERPLEDMVQTVSEQAVVLARQEMQLARRELTAKAKQAGAGAAMVGGAGFLAALAAGTGTAALVLFLSRRPRPATAALGVTGLYAAGGAALAQEGITRLRAAGPPVPEETVQSVKNLGSTKKKRAEPAQKRAKPAQKRAKPARKRAKSPLEAPSSL